MYYTINENSEIEAASDYKFTESAIYTDEEIVRGYNGQLVFMRETETEEYKREAAEKQKEQRLDALRRYRETECFTIINRGQLWYETITEKQKAELKIWYNEWLDVTETMKVPDKPIWIE